MTKKYLSLFFSSLLGAGLFLHAASPAAADTQLLSKPWSFSGTNGASEQYQSLIPTALKGGQAVTVTYNLHGLCALPGDASGLILDQNGWKVASLSQYGQNCKDGDQTVSIPLTDFKDLSTKAAFDPNQPLTGQVHGRFWANKTFRVDVIGITVTGIASATPTPMPTAVPTAAPTTTPAPAKELLPAAWTLSRSTVGAVEKYQAIAPTALQGMTNLTVTYNLNGLCLLPGDASALVFDQNNAWHMVSFANYGRNCYNGSQTVTIPLAKFPGLNLTQPVGTFHTRFWADKAFNVTISSAAVSGGTVVTPGVTPTPVVTTAPQPTPTPTVKPATGGTWAIQSVDAMKDTKDAICGQRNEAWINQWVGKAAEIGANYVAISTPYENPSCGDARAYTKLWIKAIRAKGLKVWHRQMPLAHEGIYNIPKSNATDYLGLIKNYITANPDNYQEGDIFTPIPEPQNGGISGITGCAQGVCQYASKEAFNAWLRNAMTVSQQAFQSIGRNNMKVGYFGFDGFVAFGHNNPDWNGILEPATIQQMGNITIDHYPELIGTNMAADLKEFTAMYPNVDLIIGEWGTVTGGDTEATVRNSMGAAAANPSVKGFNYWQFGPSGSGEQAINNDFTNRPQFDEIQSFYKK